MRIALCISGAARSFKSAYPYIKKAIIDPLNPDIFISTWDWKVRSDHYKQEGTLEEYKNLYNPKVFDIETWDEDTLENLGYSKYKKYEFGHFSFSKALLPMYWKIWRANMLSLEFASKNNFKYDLVIRCRSDLSFGNEISPVDIIKAVDSRLNPIYLRLDKNPYHPDIEWWVCDHFAFGRPESMNIYANTYKEIEWNILHAKHIVPELMLKAQLERHNVQYLPTPIEYNMIRS